ncbi:MAG: tetratricopeptide repeat protein [Candidatus Omnitrophica bacterium]|nr:tetratricopeptide repeat protein [Candidatus Omnitrophota bacterium]
MKKYFYFTIFIIICFGSIATVYGEKIEFTNGDSMEGKIIKETDTTVTIQFQGGTLPFQKSEIKSIIPSFSFEEELDDVPDTREEKKEKAVPSKKTSSHAMSYGDVDTDAEMSYFINFFGSHDAFLESFEKFKKTIKNNPDDFETRYKLGLSHFYVKEYEKAIAELTIVLEHNPLDLETTRYLAYSYYLLGNTEMAVTYFKNYLNGHHFDTKIRNLLAEAYYQSGNLKNALIEYKTLLEFTPSDRLLLLNVAKIYSTLGNIDKADEFRNKAQEIQAVHR